MRKPVNAFYSLTSLTEYEPLIDQMNLKFMRRLDDEFGACGKVCDMSLWMRLCEFQTLPNMARLRLADAMDVIMHLTFSDTLGFLDSGKDRNGFLKQLDTNIDRSAKVKEHDQLESEH